MTTATAPRRRFKMPAKIVGTVRFVPCDPGTNPWKPFLDACAADMRAAKASGQQVAR